MVKINKGLGMSRKCYVLIYFLALIHIPFQGTGR